MNTRRFDALIVGSGPAGSVAAVVLARGGARVALVDKARFPRDKACGDLVGPRGVQLLDDLGIRVPGRSPSVTWSWSARLHAGSGCPASRVGPIRATRSRCPAPSFDAALHDAAVAAGAEPFLGRAAAPLGGDAGLEGFRLATGIELRADVVIGADGASSHVAAAADLVDPHRVLWGFAVRAYLDAPVDAAAHRAVGTLAVACIPGLRLAVPRARRPRQPRPRSRDAVQPHRGGGRRPRAALRSSTRSARSGSLGGARPHPSSAAGSSWGWSARAPPAVGCY